MRKISTTPGSFGGRKAGLAAVLAALGFGLATVAAVAQTPVTFEVYPAPDGLGTNSAEPSIGSNWNSDRLMFIAGLQTLRVDLDECTSPPADNWTNVSADNTSIVTLDPILFTDSVTGRTFASQLSAKCSNMAFTDDDGDTWNLSQGCGINAGVDHQTVGGGPYNEDALPPSGPLGSYPHAVYYCSQDVAVAQCARSDDGGVTFGPAVPTWTAADCGGLHGAIHVDVDGTVYVPNKNCGTPARNAVAVSEDNGITWTVRPVPVSAAGNGNWDPSVWAATQPGSGANNTGVGTLYMGFIRTQANDVRRPWAAVSRDRGVTWTDVQDLGIGAGPGGNDIINTAFPVAVAGDGDRAAIGFLGAIQGGDGGGTDVNAPHVWHAYVAVTYDGGQTWTTTNVTPGDPVQRGHVCDAGTTCGASRNLLDFNDMAVDREGRIAFGFADGCIGGCVAGPPNSSSELATIARQVSGRRLFAAFDAAGPPAPPRLRAEIDADDDTLVHLTWQAPDDRSSAITGYNVYKRLEGEASASLLAAVGPNVFNLDDTLDPGGPQVFYSVTATNGFGEGSICREVSPQSSESPCVAPGITVLQDGTEDWTAPDPTTQIPEYDIEGLSINERADLGPGKIELILEMVGMANPPANSTWPVSFDFGGPRFVRMHTDALGQVFFTSGTGTDMNPTTNPGVPADPASAIDAGGSIRIVVDRSDVGNPAPGDVFDRFLVRIRRELVAASLTPDNMPDSLTPSGSYTVFGSESCDVGRDPIANDDTAETAAGVPVVIDVVANDVSFNGALTVIAVGTPANGTVADNGDGTVTYLPDEGFTGIDSFGYTIEDQAGLEDSATVTVTVEDSGPCLVPGVRVAEDPLGDTNATIDATDDPSLDIESVSIAEPFLGDGLEKLVVTLDLEDMTAPHPSAAWRVFWTSPDGQQYFVSLESCDATAGLECSYGTFDGTLFSSQGAPEGCEVDPDGTLTITVDKGLVGIDDATDGGSDLTGVNGRTQVFFGALCTGLLGQADNAGPGTYSIFTNAACGNRDPIAGDDSTSTPEDTPVTIDLLANDSDPDGDPLTVVNTGQGTNGTVVNHGDGTVTYTPDVGFVGTDSFVYTVSDGRGGVDDGTVTVDVFEAVEHRPEAGDDAYSTDEDQTLVVSVANGVLANDTDADGDTLTASGPLTGPSNGTLTLGADGAFTYTPSPDFHGSDSFTYEACDPVPLCDGATVTITVAPVNDAPVAVDDSEVTDQDTPVTVDVLANDTDVDGDTLAVDGVSAPADGTASDNGDGTVTYTPNTGFTGTDTFTYTVSDGQGGSDVGTVTIEVRQGGGLPPCPGEDDDDFDSDGKRDDEDSDDDSDGVHDDEDSDDDNDGKNDDEDSDDDEDCIPDEFDGESTRELHSAGFDQVDPGRSKDSMVAVDAGALLLIALVEGPDVEGLVVEIYDPSGGLVSASVPAPGGLLATAVPAGPGDFAVRVRNDGTEPKSYKRTLVVRHSWQ